MIRRRNSAVRLVVLALLSIAPTTVLAAPPTSAAAPQPRPPSQDSFYRYSGHRSLASLQPGTIVKRRSIDLSLGSSSTPVPAEQLLYRTTDQLGRPTVAVTTVAVPGNVPALPDVVEYLSFYDGLGSRCDPSYTLAGGNPGSANESETEEEELLINWYLSNGWIVTIPDFEGVHLHWMAGRQSGYATLDAARATETYLHLASHTKVGLSGYSGGAVAADWASELGPSYASRVNLVGVAEGGIPVDYAHMFQYINGDQVYSSVMPGMLLGLARAFHVKLAPYLSRYGAKLVAKERHACIGSVFGNYPGLRYQRLVKHRYRNLLHVRVFARMFDENIMGTVRGHPRVPLFMGVGDADGTGDGVMRVADVEALAHEYCKQGVSVDFQEYRGASHETAGVYFEPETGPFLQARFAGTPATSNCSSIGPGDSLAPSR